MKKILTLIMVVGFFTSYAIGQSADTRSNFNFGIKAGGNFSNVYDARGDDFRADGKLGFVGGLFFTVPLGDMFGIQPEILFSQKGFKATGSFLENNYGLTRTTNWIDIPLYLAVKPIPILTILAGPQFSYLLKRKNEFRSESGLTEIIEEFDTDNIRKNVMAVVAGVDVNINPLIIGVRAGWDLSTNNGDGTSQTPRYKNAWIQATLGYRLL